VGESLIASRVGATPALVSHDVNGLLVPPGDPAALAAAITRILTELGTAAADETRSEGSTAARDHVNMAPAAQSQHNAAEILGQAVKTPERIAIGSRVMASQLPRDYSLLGAPAILVLSSGVCGYPRWVTGRSDSFQEAVDD
jgi:hypothetical protein